MAVAIEAKYMLVFQAGHAQIKENQTVVVEDGIIKEIGSKVATNGHEVIKLPHHVLMPGMINSHTHAAMSLFRGYADDLPLDKWLNDYIWPAEAKLKPEHVKIGAEVSAVEAIQSGITTVNSMYWHPDQEISAFLQHGVRIMTGPPIISGFNSLEMYKPLIKEFHGRPDDMARISLNPHAPYTVTAEEYQEVSQFKQDYNANPDHLPLRIHTHVAESPIEMQQIRDFAAKSGFSTNEATTPVEYLDHLGVLDADVIAAHSIECSPADLKTLADHHVGVPVDLISNLKLGNNAADIPTMTSLGVRVGLGTDGSSSNNSMNMFETMKMTSLYQKGLRNDPTVMPAEQMLQLATTGSAAAIGWDKLGRLEQGYKADLIAIDLQSPHLQPLISSQSIISHLVYSAQPSDVSDVMVDGKWRMRQHQVLNVDLNQLYDRLADAVHDLLDV